MGAVAIAMPAIISGISILNLPWNNAKPTIRVRNSWRCRKMRATSNSFHTKSEQTTDIDRMIGLARGRIILQNIPKLPQPSIKAASINSCGMVVKKLRNRYIEKGRNIPNVNYNSRRIFIDQMDFRH